MQQQMFSAMRQSIIDGLPDTATGLAQEALSLGIAPLDAINNGFGSCDLSDCQQRLALAPHP
jgi:methanogenic corrinoid protein MtbC1